MASRPAPHLYVMNGTMRYLGSIILVILVLIGGWWLLTRERKPVAQDLPGEDPIAIESRTVTYFNDVEGYYAGPRESPREGEEYPGVVLVHEWWGLNDTIKAMADELAGQGYRVLAVDLFNGTVASNPEEARAQVSALNQEEATTNMRGAVAYLRGLRSERIGVLGWCFGGGQALQLSRTGEPLAATVIYYGQVTENPDELRAVRSPVLGIFGEEDTSIPVSQVEAFTSALTSAGIQNEIYVYPGVGHAFANPSNPDYAPEETRDAWAKTLAFLTATLKGQ